MQNNFIENAIQFAAGERVIDRFSCVTSCVTLYASEMRHMHLCSLKMVYAYLGYVCSGASMLTLSVISLDRWFAITMPRAVP